ncbi:MAG: hypothetical protein HFG22_07415 [Lachnospiraceae bacterium]|nr:hypothetical protein [Lachnospiraceae bacterium]
MKKKTVYIMLSIVFFIFGHASGRYLYGRYVALTEDKEEKFFLLSRTLDRWFMSKQRGRLVYKTLSENGYHDIAIYGIGYLGERLLDELNGTDINVKYVIDRNANNIDRDIKIVRPEDGLEAVDAIIVTPVLYYHEIKKKLSEKIDLPIISIENII